MSSNKDLNNYNEYLLSLPLVKYLLSIFMVMQTSHLILTKMICGTDF